jgi:hypothetical protein
VDILIHLHTLSLDETLADFIRYTPDSLLHLAGLINAGLIRADFSLGSSGYPAKPRFAQFQVCLTDAGRMLMEAWLAGDEGRVRESLSRLGGG